MNPKVSVIVPVYNSERYLQQCINSVLNQSFKDFEIICVVCNSKDNSLEIVKNFAKKDKRIKLYEREYEYVAASKNFAINKAKGKYLTFLDSDDEIFPYGLEMAYNYAERNSAEVLLLNAISSFNDKFNNWEFNFAPILNCSLNNLINLKSNVDIFSLPNFAWAKLYLTDFLKSNNILFDNIKFAEDTLFCCKCYAYATKIFIQDIPFYHYRIHNNNTTGAFDSNYKDLTFAYKNSYDFLRDYGNSYLEKSFCNCIIHTMSYFYQSYKLKTKNKNEFRRLILELYKKVYIETNFIPQNSLAKEFFILEYKNDEIQKYRTILKLRVLGIKIILIKQKDNNYKIYFCGLPVIKITKG